MKHTQKYYIKSEEARKITTFFKNSRVDIKIAPAIAELAHMHAKCMTLYANENIDLAVKGLEEKTGCKARKNIYGALAILRKEEKILLLEQIESKPFAGYWYPPGGSPEKGETVRQAAEREIMEEFGIIAKAGDILQVVPSDYKSLYSVFIDFRFVRYLYGDIKPKIDEVKRFGWFTVKEGLNNIKLMTATRTLFQMLELKDMTGQE